jgi:hypothetical protein
LAGEEIPLAARIVAVADVYDALRSKRVYKQALPHEECMALIAEASGTQFDPRVVEVFLRIDARIRQLANYYEADEGSAGDRPRPRNSQTTESISSPNLDHKESMSPRAVMQLDETQTLLEQAVQGL